MATSTSRRPPMSQRSRKAQQERRRNLIVGGVVAVVVLVLAVVIGLLASNASANRVPLEDIVGSPSITGDPLPPLPDDITNDPAVGLSVPVVEGTTLDGAPITVGEPGRAQVVGLLASWCPACQQELPVISSWVDDGGIPDDVDLVLVNVFSDPNRPNWPPTEWYEEEGYTGPVLADSAASDVATSYGMGGVPSWVVIDETGTAVFRVTGLLEREQLDQLVELARLGA